MASIAELRSSGRGSAAVTVWPSSTAPPPPHRAQSRCARCPATPCGWSARSAPPRPRSGLHGADMGHRATLGARLSARIQHAPPTTPQVRAPRPPAGRSRGPSQVSSRSVRHHRPPSASPTAVTMQEVAANSSSWTTFGRSDPSGRDAACIGQPHRTPSPTTGKPGVAAPSSQRDKHLRSGRQTCDQAILAT